MYKCIYNMYIFFNIICIICIYISVCVFRFVHLYLACKYILGFANIL